MSADAKSPVPAPGHEITLDDLRHKALAIRDDVTDEAKKLAQERRSQTILVGVAVVALAIGLAYYVGSRAGASAASRRGQSAGA